jgi:hypothetical protein
MNVADRTGAVFVTGARSDPGLAAPRLATGTARRMRVKGSRPWRPIEPWAYTPAEFAEMLAAGNSFALEIEERGKDL